MTIKQSFIRMLTGGLIIAGGFAGITILTGWTMIWPLAWLLAGWWGWWCADQIKY